MYYKIIPYSIFILLFFVYYISLLLQIYVKLLSRKLGQLLNSLSRATVVPLTL